MIFICIEKIIRIFYIQLNVEIFRFGAQGNPAQTNRTSVNSRNDSSIFPIGIRRKTNIPRSVCFGQTMRKNQSASGIPENSLKIFSRFSSHHIGLNVRIANMNNVDFAVCVFFKSLNFFKNESMPLYSEFHFRAEQYRQYPPQRQPYPFPAPVVFQPKHDNKKNKTNLLRIVF